MFEAHYQGHLCTFERFADGTVIIRVKETGAELCRVMTMQRAKQRLVQRIEHRRGRR